MSAANPSRRQFVAASAAVITPALIASHAHAAGSDTIRVGLIGCGGRGTDSVVQALQADGGARLVAVGDLFGDMLENSLRSLRANERVADRVDVPEDCRFVGFDAYKGVIDHCDVVCMATSPHFRPLHLKYAVEKGVHAFVEKPVAVDPAGVRDIFETCRRAADKRLSIVSGLCWRYHHGKRATVGKIHEGAIGDIVTAETFYLAGPLWHRGRKPQWSEMEYQCRNWLYFDWLSGDFITEQHIHSLDKIAWVMGDTPPVRVTSLGGRQQRTDSQYGNVYDHFSTVYEYAHGVKAYSHCRQMGGVTNNVSDKIFGTQGTATLLGFNEPADHIADRSGSITWRYQHPRGAKPDNMYQNEHDELFAAIRSGIAINNGDYMCKSSMMAIIARLSAYSGQMLEWDKVWNSPLDLSPARYEWGEAPQRPIAVPGQYALPA
jgi:predicted dehydrogenase